MYMMFLGAYGFTCLLYARPQESKQAAPPDTTRVICRNLLITFPVIWAAAAGLDESRPLLPLPGPLPRSLWISAGVRMLVLFLVEDVLFYGVHRMLHIPWLYRHVHHVHHRWVRPEPHTAFYAHPLEHLAGNIIPPALAGLASGLPVCALKVWVVLAVTCGVRAHSQVGAPHGEHHQRHHRYFGAVGAVDYLLGTY
jgi:sterol desaturase/sphingolipid hydroxylase (fatty acid hydroxylase superfamily)